MKVIACIIARTVSTRLPLKILRDIEEGVSMIDFLVKRIKKVPEIQAIYICTSNSEVDDILEDVAIRNKINIYRGSEHAVIERMLYVGEKENADILIRITGDNPLTTTEYLSNQINLLIKNNLDYTRIIDVPIGASAEVITYRALKDCYSKIDPNISEYLMLFIFEPNQYKCGVLKIFKENYSSYSVTVDTLDDLIRTRKLLKKVTNEYVSLEEIIKIYKSDSQEELPSKSFTVTEEVKLPYGKTISFEEFQLDMTRRKNQSKFFKLYE